ncbi:unnamed protein product [marine sediment metagenome]|uniref:Uncharacterized protein n=1 Tax=marine sediment metagenome TaxID=412755 RepID=X1UHF8_9ZZZZ
MYNKKSHSHYNFENFKKACKNKGLISISENVRADADNYFRLRTKKDIIDFIENDGLEDLVFINTKPWENNPNKKKIIMVDSYEFRSSGKLGYISIKCNNGIWTIKSFHLSGDMNYAMRNAINKLDIIKKLGGKI